LTATNKNLIPNYDVVSCPMEEGDMQFFADRVLVAQIAANLVPSMRMNTE